jgi:hypothetical protein
LKYLTVFDKDRIPISTEDDGCLLLEEAKTYGVEMQKKSQGSRVYLGAIELKQRDDGLFVLWTGHMVGHSVLRICHEGQTDPISIPIRIQPRSEKLSASTWLVMLREIEEWLPGGTVGIQGARLGSVGNEGVPASLLAEALLPLIPLFERSVRQVLENPRQLDGTRLEDCPLWSALRVDRETMRWVSRHPKIAVWLDPWPRTDLHGPEPHVHQRRSIDLLDHPANRYISWILRRVAECLEKVAETLLEFAGEDSELDSTDWCTARAERALSASRRISYLWRNSFLGKIPRAPLTDAAFSVILDDPSYGRLHTLGRQFLSPLFGLDSAANKPKAGVRPSFHLYELWCFLSTKKAFQDLLSGWTWTDKGIANLLQLKGSGSGAEFRAMDNSGQRLTIDFNPVFAGYHAREGKSRWSISGERRPDIVVSLAQPDGTLNWLCLDAKYRVGRQNLSEAFASVHIYRDSLRYGDKELTCRAAALLAPSILEGTEEWFSTSFFEEFGCGVWERHPGRNDDGHFAKWMLSCLQ